MSGNGKPDRKAMLTLIPGGKLVEENPAPEDGDDDGQEEEREKLTEEQKFAMRDLVRSVDGFFETFSGDGERFLAVLSAHLSVRFVVWDPEEEEIIYGEELLDRLKRMT